MDPQIEGFEQTELPYQVRIENFEGPLDLLLHLIKKNEINICDIPIAMIAQQYLALYPEPNAPGLANNFRGIAERTQDTSTADIRIDHRFNDSNTLFAACHAYVHLGRYKEALDRCERAVASDNFYWVYLDLVAAYAQTGDMARAEAAKAQLLKRVPDFTISRLLAKQFSSDPVWNEEIRTRFVPGWRKAGLPE